MDRVWLVGGTGWGRGIRIEMSAGGVRRRTILCLGTIGRSGLASQAHELS